MATDIAAHTTCPEPPDDLITALRQNRAVAVIGSGLSAAAGLPSWDQLLYRLVWRTERTRPDQRSRLVSAMKGVASGRYLDTADMLKDILQTTFHSEISRHLQRKMDDLKPNETRSGDGAPLFENNPTSSELVTKPTAAHRILVQLPWRAIVTTNYDTLIEEARPNSSPQAYSRSAPGLGTLVQAGKPFILKLHGDVHHLSDLVLARSEYAPAVFGSEARSAVESLFRSGPPFWLGYGHNDPDLDLLLDKLRVELSVGGGFALVKSGDELLMRRFRAAHIFPSLLSGWWMTPEYLNKLARAAGTNLVFSVVVERPWDGQDNAEDLANGLAIALNKVLDSGRVSAWQVHAGSVVIELEALAAVLDELRDRLSKRDSALLGVLQSFSVVRFGDTEVMGGPGRGVGETPSKALPSPEPVAPRPEASATTNPQAASSGARTSIQTGVGQPSTTPKETTTVSAMEPKHTPEASPPTEPAITWLHLTDLHRRGERDDKYWPHIKARLWEEILDPPSSKLTRPDIVFFTGDLAFSGKTTQYEDVWAFFQELFEKLGGEVPIIAVPGNHDVQRPSKMDTSRYDWLRHFDEEDYDERRAALWAPKDEWGDRSAIKDLFLNYDLFSQQKLSGALRHSGKLYSGAMPGDVLASLNLGGFRLGVVGLNSAWRQFKKGDFRERITIDPRQFTGLAMQMGGQDTFKSAHHLRILLQHHPPCWLSSHAEPKRGNHHQWQGLIEPYFDLTLFGHMHTNEAEVSFKNGNVPRTRVQGRSLFGVEHWESKEEDRRFGLGWGRAEVKGKETRVTLWARKLVETGGWSFRHPEDVEYRARDGMILPPFNVGDSVPGDASSDDGQPGGGTIPRPSSDLLAWERSYLKARQEIWCNGQPDLLRGLSGSGKRPLARAQLYVSLKAEVGLCWLEDERFVVASREDPVRRFEARWVPVTGSEAGADMNVMWGEQAKDKRSQAYLEQAISAPELTHLVVEGDPGSGKTVLLEHVAHVLALHHLRDTLPSHHLDLEVLRQGRDRVPMPILLKASVLAAGGNGHTPGGHSLVEAIKDEVKAATAQVITDETILEGLKEGRYLLLIDALDEVPTQEERLAVVRCLQALANYDEWPGRMVLTTRPTEFTGVHIGRRLRRVHIASLDESTSGQMMMKWCGVHGKDSAYFGEMAAAIKEASRKHTASLKQGDRHSFIENPMLLTSAMLVYVGQGCLPEDTVSLYHEMVDILCKGRKHGLKKEARREALEIVAEILQRRRVTVSPLDRVADDFLAVKWRPSDYPDVPAVRELLLQLGDRTGLLRFEEHKDPDTDRPQRRVRFWHRSFQEFLCARRLALEDGAVNAKTDALLKPQEPTGEERASQSGGHLPPIALDPAWEGVMRFLTGVYGLSRGELARHYIQRLHDHVTGTETTTAQSQRYRGRLLGLIANGLVDYKQHFQGQTLVESIPGEIVAAFMEKGREWPIQDRLMAFDALGRLGDPRLVLDDVWVEIPGGACEIGGDEVVDKWFDKMRLGDEYGSIPATSIACSPFKMSWRPVTVSDFKPFVDDNGYEEHRWWQEGWTPDSKRPEQWEEQLHHPNRPVVAANWYEAMAWCQWATETWGASARGERITLPTEAQWEYAARGPLGEQGSFFPWGNEDPTQGEDPHANFNNEPGYPSPVGVFPRGNRAHLADLAGNVWEWCLDTYARDPRPKWRSQSYHTDKPVIKMTNPVDPCHFDDSPNRVLRGGSWGHHNPMGLRCACRNRHPAVNRNPIVGFRVVCVVSSAR